MGHQDILEDLAGWQSEFEAGWYKEYQDTGVMNWKKYKRPTNQNAPSGKAVKLSNSKVGLISSGGFYLPDSQPPFDAENDLGDYTLRKIPWHTSFDDIAIAHTHYDHTAVNQDSEILWPVGHLAAFVEEGIIGSVAEHAFSFSGYLPMAHRTVNELIPEVVATAKTEGLDAAFLVPA
ncbi:MAG: glycine/sarcosine/betaine reductase selenoprotein B family protein [Chloroflexota bacterium]